MIWKQRTDWKPEDVVKQQLRLNHGTWAELQRHGVNDDTQVRLDFFYDAPDDESAEALARFLWKETDYEVRRDERRVSGTTLETTVSQEILDDWVIWMVLAGHENGRCKFDGWGTQIP